MTRNLALIGLQAGDEGKGVRAGYLIERAVENSWQEEINYPTVLVERYQGGADAGHTVEHNGKRYAHHQVPSGITFNGTYNLIGEGTFLNIRKIMKEIRELSASGVIVSPKNLGIASNVQVTLDYHVFEDKRDFDKEKHTSTGNGIKQTAVDKFGRVGIRFQEFLNRNDFVEILRETRFNDGSLPAGFKSLEEFADSYAEERDFLRGFSVLQSDVVDRDFAYRIGEGAQGYLIDVDKGLYNGTTSSNPVIVPFRTDVLFGVIKMYKSSIGANRPFIGQFPADLEKNLRGLWKEKGTSTGKPRDLGFVDMVELRHAVRDTKVDYLIGTCGDRMEVLASLGQKPTLTVGYKIDGRTYVDWDESFHNRRTLYRAKPVVEEFEPWDRFFDPQRKRLTGNAQRYIDRIEEITGKEFVLHGYGPDVKDVHETKNIFFLL